MRRLSEFDRDPQGRHRKHAEALHPRGHRGARHLNHPTAPVLLAIETAGANCSAAVACGDKVLAAERMALRHGHAEALLPMIERVMAAAGLRPGRLDAVAAAVGPGGFTGIRVGLAAAHGIALAARARLVGVTSFAAVAASVAAPEPGGVEALLVALDSRREDLYVQLFAADLVTPLTAPAAVRRDHLAAHVGNLAGAARLLVAGDAAETAAAALRRRDGVTLHPGSAPDALGVIAAARRLIRDPASARPMRPLYLRPPDVTLPRPPSGAGVVA